MRMLLSAVILLTLAFPSFAAAPRVEIVGPSDGQPGDLIDLASDDEGATHWLWHVQPSRFNDGRVTFRVGTDGRTCQVASRPGVYKVLLVVSNQDGPSIAWHTVTIFATSPPAPDPPAPPTPGPQPPTPPTPPAVPELTTWVRDNVTALVTKDSSRAETARVLADQYDAFAKGGAVLTDATVFTKGQDGLNRLVVTTRNVGAAWDSFFAKLAEKLASMNLTTVGQHVAIWPQISAGLRQVK